MLLTVFASLPLAAPPKTRANFQASLEVPERYSPPEGELIFQNPFVDTTASLLKLNHTPLWDDIDIDFEQRTVMVRKMAEDYEMWSYFYPEMEGYLDDHIRFSQETLWHQNLNTSLKKTEAEKGGGSLFEVEIPVRMPIWMNRFAGTEKPKLTISGCRKIIFEGNSTWNPNEDAPEGRGRSRFPDLKMDQESQFTVRGTVGRLIDVQINQDSDAEALGQQLRDQVKIHYKGEGDELEDEIIQEVEAGNTHLSLPNTEFSGYSESHKGLFGIKVRSKIGDLEITSIASQEKGEGQKVEFTIGQQERPDSIRDHQYLKNRYFFLNTMFANAYKSKRRPEYGVKDIMVFAKTTYHRNPDEKIEEWPVKISDGTTKNFRLLGRDVDYELQRELGYIRLNFNMESKDDILAVYYVNTKGEEFGDTTNFGWNEADADRPPLEELKILKDLNQGPDSPTWELAWRNVYGIGQISKENARDAKIEILLGDTIDNQLSNNKMFTSLLQVAKEDGTPRVGVDTIFNLERGELIFPVINGNMEPFNNGDVLDVTHPDIYEDKTDLSHLYTIVVTAVSRRDDYSLGFNVIENSEKVKLNGRVLEKDKDYTISYEVGNLVLTTPEATAGSRLEVEYESESIFIAEQKIFLGSRLEYRLPAISDASYIGASILYKTESVAEKRAQVGREPYRKLLLDVNSKLVFNPEWMTVAADALPLVQTNETSTFELAGEIAHSRTNPNTKDEAMVDDFEGSDVNLPLGVGQVEWKRASPPDTAFRPDTLVPGHFWWFNPARRVEQDKIWDIKTSVDEKYIDVLNMEFKPYDTSGNSWGGIMRAMLPGYRDHRLSKFLEITMKGNSGFLTVDLGEISEDLSINGQRPNGKLDTEDKPDAKGRRDEILQASEDLGLDTLDDRDEFFLRPNANRDGWDTLGYGNSDLPNAQDPAGDNYNSQDSSKVNGTQGNYNAGDHRYRLPESEDIDKSTFLDGVNRFFRYTLDLSNDSSNYAVPETERNGWKLYRIPLAGSDHDRVDTVRHAGRSPDWGYIKGVRLTVSGQQDTSRSSTIQIARIEFVGNQWRVVDSTVADSAQPVLGISVVNTHKNKDYATSINDHRKHLIEMDRTTGNPLREQSLQLTFDNIEAGDVVMARRIMAAPISFLNYDSIEIDVHGHEHFDTEDSVMFFLRLGTDDSASYYEFRTPLREGWETYKLPLSSFAEFKAAVRDDLGERDTINADGIGVSGSPQYAKIKKLYLGVRVAAGTASSGEFSGKIWVNELKLTGIRKEPGWAGRVSFNSGFADLLEVNGMASYEDGNFVNLGQKERIGDGITTVRGKLGSQLYMDKFLRSQWGVQLPLTASIEGNLSRPRFQPNQDVELGQDNFRQIFPEVLRELTGSDRFKGEETPSMEYQSKEVTRNIGLSYSKNIQSPNIFANFLADRSGGEYGYRRAHKADYASWDSTTEHTGRVAYSLTPRETKEYRPFQKAKSKKVPAMVKGLRFNPLPTKLDFGLVDAVYNWERQVDRRSERTVKNLRKLDLGHDMDLSFEPANQLRLSYGVGMDRNLNDQVEEILSGGMTKINEHVLALDPTWGKNLILKEEVDRSQNFDSDWNPSFVSWLTHGLKYQSDYEHHFNDERQMEMNIHATSTMDFGFKPIGFFTKAQNWSKPVKPLHLGFGYVKKGLEVISLRSISGNYSVGTKHSLHKLEEIPLSRWDYFQYQLGIWDRSAKQIFYNGEVDANQFGQTAYWLDRDYEKHTKDSRSITRNLRGNTSVEVILSTTLRGNAAWGREVTVYADTGRSVDSTVTYPDWGIALSNSRIGRMPGIKRNVKSLTINSDYDYARKRTLLDNREKVLVERKMSPLVGVTVNWKNDVRSEYRRNHARNDEDVFEPRRNTVTREKGDSVSVSYSIKREKGIKFWKWNPRLKNNLDISFGIGRSHREQERIDNPGSDDASTTTTEDVETLSYGPSARYYFTNKIDGGLDINYTKIKDVGSRGTTKNIKVGIWAKICF